MLADPLDLARRRAGARRLLAIGLHDAVAAICDSVQLGNTGLPVAGLVDAPDGEVDDWLLSDCSDAQHDAGSCRMGPADFDDGTSVVDPGCCVRRLEALRVIDASVMPTDCRANTCLTTIMIAERMAAHLRAELA
jgi:choline dehydrogenase